jgi:hypothetical protein
MKKKNIIDLIYKNTKDENYEYFFENELNNNRLLST